MRPSINVISAELIGQVLDEAKRILAEIGVEVRGPALRQHLLELGLAERDTAGDGLRVLFPPDVVDRALASAPREFLLYGRDGQPHATIGGDHVHFTPGSSGLKILDHRSGETRPASTRDFVEYARLCDGLEHIANLATAFSTNDIEPQVSDAWRLYLALTNSRKPVVSGAFTEHGVPRMAEMMALDAQGGTGLSGTINVEQLTHDKEVRRGLARPVLGQEPFMVTSFCTPADSARMFADLSQSQPAARVDQTRMHGKALPRPENRLGIDMPRLIQDARRPDAVAPQL